MDKGKVEDWKEETAGCVWEKIFPKQQFLVSDACLDMGGYIQRHVTKFINVLSQSTSRLFWDEHGGREMVRNTFQRKWQAAQNAMKVAFKGK
jgi:capsid protein